MDYSTPALCRARRLAFPLGKVLADCKSEALEAIKAKLSSLHVEELNRRLSMATAKVEIAAEMGNAVPQTVRVEFWLCNCEYTKRGIPPVFRKLPSPNDDDPDQIADLFAVDLEWLTVAYPEQVADYARWRRLWQPGQLHGVSDHISLHYPRREMWWFVKGLGRLAPEQQKELHFVKKCGFSRYASELMTAAEEARIIIAMKYHARDGRYKTDDPKATIERRFLIWQVGAFCDWKPQPTANLYNALTGDGISRALAAKIIAQVTRDVPGKLVPKLPKS